MKDPGTDIASGAATGAAAGSAVPVIGTGLGAVIGGGLKLLGGLFGGGKKTESGYKLPPAMELEMLRSSKDNLAMLSQNIDQIGQLMKSYDQRINLITKGIEGTIPSDELNRQITENSAQIALGLGADAQQLIQDGFLDQDDIARIEELDELNSQEFTDEAFEQEFKQQRAALEQQLLRDGRSLAEVSQTLMQFDSQKAVERQQRGETLRQGAFNRGLTTLQMQSQLRQQGFGNVLQSFQASQMQNQSTQQGFNNLAQLATMNNQTQMQGISGQTNLAGAQQGIYDQLAKYKLDNNNVQSVYDPEGYAASQKKIAEAAAKRWGIRGQRGWASQAHKKLKESK